MSARFPDVPNTPGVPLVYRNGDNPGTAIVVSTATNSDQLSPALWAFTDQNGNIILSVDSVISIEPQREYRVSTYPQEQGGFQSYNKVSTPGDIRAQVVRYQNLDKFLATLDTLVSDITLVNIITPNTIFFDYTLTRYEYRREARNGVTMITADLSFVEVRQTAVSAFTRSKNPSGQKQVNLGPVRTTTP